jgi:hypothetical protein
MMKDYGPAKEEEGFEKEEVVLQATHCGPK